MAGHALRLVFSAVLTDGSSTSTSIPLRCFESEFECYSGVASCVKRKYQCDGDADCDDGSDEYPWLCTATTLTSTTLSAIPQTVLNSRSPWLCQLPCDGDSEGPCRWRKPGRRGGVAGNMALCLPTLVNGSCAALPTGAQRCSDADLAQAALLNSVVVGWSGWNGEQLSTSSSPPMMVPSPSPQLAVANKSLGDSLGTGLGIGALSLAIIIFVLRRYHPATDKRGRLKKMRPLRKLTAAATGSTTEAGKQPDGDDWVMVESADYCGENLSDDINGESTTDDGHTTMRYGSVTSVQSTLPKWSSLPPLAMAKFDWVPEEGENGIGKVRLHEGELVRLDHYQLDNTADGWCTGTVRADHGYFPRTYIEPYPDVGSNQYPLLLLRFPSPPSIN